MVQVSPKSPKPRKQILCRMVHESYQWKFINDKNRQYDLYNYYHRIKYLDKNTVFLKFKKCLFAAEQLPFLLQIKILQNQTYLFFIFFRILMVAWQNYVHEIVQKDISECLVFACFIFVKFRIHFCCCFGILTEFIVKLI